MKKKHKRKSLIKAPKKAKPLPQFVRETDMDRLIDNEEMWDTTYKSILARTIIIMIYETGVRRSELIGLNDTDIDFNQRTKRFTNNEFANAMLTGMPPRRGWEDYYKLD